MQQSSIPILFLISSFLHHHHYYNLHVSLAQAYSFSLAYPRGFRLEVAKEQLVSLYASSILKNCLQTILLAVATNVNTLRPGMSS